MKKIELEKDRIFTLRKCMSTQRISMEIIPEFSPQPYFVRKQHQQNKFLKANILSPRKNKFIQTKKFESVKEKITNSNLKKQSPLKEQLNFRNFNSPLKLQQILPQFFHSERQIDSKNLQQKLQNQSENNFSDDKLSSSKSVRFSNRLQDNLSIKSKRQGSRTPSILKNKNRKYGAGLTSPPSQRSLDGNHIKPNQLKKKGKDDSNANNVIKKKYESILKGLQLMTVLNKPPLSGRRSLKVSQQLLTKSKFKDDIFPPVITSVFPPNPKNTKSFTSTKDKQIQWKRISQLFPNQKLVVYDKPQQVSKYYDSSKQESNVMKIRIIKGQNSLVSQFMITAFNAIKNNDDLLNKIFQTQQVNDYGIYLLKIFQQNQWKYIIIDDFLPVRKSEPSNLQNPYEPVFIDIKPQNEEDAMKRKINKTSQKSLPIWPFLLQKAYANYYSSYEALTHGDVLDFLSQLCGISFQKINLVEKTDPQEYLQIIDRLLISLKNGNVVILGQLKDNLPMIPLHYKAQFCYSMITEQELFYYDPNQDYRASKIKFYDLGIICTHLYLFAPSKYLHQITNTISKPKQKPYNSLRSLNKNKNLIERDQHIIQKFVLNSTNEILLFIRQKQKRFLYRLEIDYIWLRVLLVKKEYDGSYSWIDGEYTNKKGLSFNYLLDAGQYFILLYPQWGTEKYNHQIHITLYTNERLQTFQKIPYDVKEKMLQQACSDLAQKNGKLKQINQYICTYNFIDKKSALIIESIVNERLYGEVNIVRSIQGLKSSVQILPVNEEFYENVRQISKQQDNKCLAIRKTSIDVKIPKGQSYTVILRMKGGIDSNFFKVFNFGS